MARIRMWPNALIRDTPTQKEMNCKSRSRGRKHYKNAVWNYAERSEVAQIQEVQERAVLKARLFRCPPKCHKVLIS